jgi:hypothetical protein
VLFTGGLAGVISADRTAADGSRQVARKPVVLGRCQHQGALDQQMQPVARALETTQEQPRTPCGASRGKADVSDLV